EDVFRFRGNPIVLLELLRDRLPQLANARSGRVLREAVIEGLLRRVDDVRRRREVGLSDREREDLLAAGLQVRDEVADADRRGWFDREDALRETGHGGSGRRKDRKGFTAPFIKQGWSAFLLSWVKDRLIVPHRGSIDFTQLGKTRV